VSARFQTNVVRAGENDDDLRVDAIELSVLDAPEYVLDAVAPPAEVGGVPAEEVRVPVREILRIVRCAPAPRDRVALEVQVDGALRAFSKQLLVREHRVRIRPRRRLICWLRSSDCRWRRCRTSHGTTRCKPAIEIIIRPRKEVFPVRRVGMSAVVPA